jgi:methylamine--corrinoid protein Co-methyltransferase
MVSGCASGIADIAAADEANGVRRTDGYAIPTTAELKTDYDCLHRLAYCMDTGILVQPYACPTMGGWAGGPEGVALATVAQGIMCVVVSQARNGKGYVGTGPNLQAPAIDTDRKSIWSSVLGAQAISRNTNLIHGLWTLSAAGPGTEMQLWEIAALAIPWLVSGASITTGAVRRWKVKHLLGSALENRWLAEVVYASAGMKRTEANELVKQILPKYESQITKEGGPWGHTFDEIHDLQTLEIRKEYLDIYSKVKKELENLGVKFKK